MLVWWLGLAACTTNGVDVTVTLSGYPDGLWSISPYLASMSLVYSWAPDRIYGNATYKNTTVRDWVVANNLSVARYPAGEASYYNWENPSGNMGPEYATLNPKANVSGRMPPEDWMSLDEYLDLCNATGMTPLIGVNYNCKENFWVPQNESIARAVRQVQHVVSRGFPGALWYIGNEDSAQDHIDLVVAHARAMKAVDPTIRTFWNNNQQGGENLKKFIAAAGDALDGVEFHGKWPFGGTPKISPFSYDDWLRQVPLQEAKRGQTWRAIIAELRAAAAEVGRPDFLFANNEYGLGKPDSMTGFNRFTKSMVVVEFAMELVVANYFSAAFWDNGGGSGEHDEHMLFAQEEGWRFNPVHIGLEMLAESSGLRMLNVTSKYTNPNVHIDRVHGFAAVGDGRLRVYLINKMESVMSVRVTLPDAKYETGFTAESMVDTDDHWGARNTSISVSCDGTGVGYCDVELPPVSFTLLKSAEV